MCSSSSESCESVSLPAVPATSLGRGAGDFGYELMVSWFLIVGDVGTGD